MRLARLVTRGLKARDHTLSLSPVTLLVGANGSGKSEAIQALHLLARGEVPGLPRTPEGVMRLARGPVLSVVGTADDGATMGRTWTRADDGTVSTQIVGAPRGVGRAAAAGAITATLGAWLETWRPDDLLTQPPATIRRRLLDLLGGSDTRPPADLLAVLPQEGDLEGDDDAWREYAHGRLSRDLATARAEVRRLDAAIDAAAFVVRPDVAPVRARLEALRGELAEAEVLADLREQLAEAEAAAQAAGPVPDVAAARQARDTAEAQLRSVRGAWEAHREALGRVESFRRDLVSLGATETADLTDVHAEEEEAIAARVHADQCQDRLDDAKLAAVKAEALVGALEVVVPGCCPACGHDLAVQHRRRLDEAREAARAQDERTGAAQEASRDAVRRLRERLFGVGRARLGDEARVLLARAWAAQEMAGAPPDMTLERAAGVVTEARQRLAEVEREEHRRVSAGAAADSARALRQRIAGLSARGVAEIEADIRAEEARLVTFGAQLEEAAQLDDLRGQRDSAQAIEATAAARVRALEAYERGVLDAVRARLEAPLTEAVGAPVTIELTDARGGPTCRIHVGGVDVASISTGERLRFTAALLVVLGRESRAAWRPVLLDGVEAVSREHREALLSRLVEAVRRGDIDQVIAAGCPDVVPHVDGVEVIDLGAVAAVEVA